VIAAITAAELLVGIQLADDHHRATREVFVAGFVDLPGVAVKPMPAA
jgi:hypothetical protein